MFSMAVKERILSKVVTKLLIIVEFRTQTAILFQWDDSGFNFYCPTVNVFQKINLMKIITTVLLKGRKFVECRVYKNN